MIGSEFNTGLHPPTFPLSLQLLPLSCPHKHTHHYTNSHKHTQKHFNTHIYIFLAVND